MKRIVKPLPNAKELLLKMLGIKEEALEDLLMGSHAAYEISDLENVMKEYASQVLENAKGTVKVHISRQKGKSQTLMNYNDLDRDGNGVIVDIDNESIDQIKSRLR